MHILFAAQEPASSLDFSRKLGFSTTKGRYQGEDSDIRREIMTYTGTQMIAI